MQVFFLHLASIAVWDIGGGRHENAQPSVDLLTRFASVLKSSIRFDETFSDVASIMKCAAPSAVPLLLAMEFARRVLDEEIIKCNILSNIERGEDTDLAFLRTKPDTIDEDDDPSKREAIRKAEKERKEAEFLNSLPSRERAYLMERKVDIARIIQEVLKLTDTGRG